MQNKTNDNIVGTVLGIYEVLNECDYRSKDGHQLYHVKCTQCSKEFDMTKVNIKNSKKCIHLKSFTWKCARLRSIFNGMKYRCYHEDNKDYRWYGARGIKICDEWLNNPKSFEDWALANGYADGLTINRINENKDYCPENCEWITGSDNSKYKSTTSLIDVDGEVHTGKEWATILGFGPNRINTYMREYGMDNTVEFIRRYQKTPTLKPKQKNQSYYSVYMQNSSSILG